MMRRLLCLALLLPSLAWASAPRTIQWADLVPVDAPKIAPQTAPLHDLSQMGAAIESAPAARQQAPDAPVVKALNGVDVRLPGFIVPIDVNEDGRTTDFLLVPYYGACIHVPPPPSNQIVHVTSKAGVKLEELYQPYWIEGPLHVEHSSSDLADAGYQINADKIYPYELQE